MKVAQYVDIDCDLHSSTVSVLEWMFSSGLIQRGTLIGYDDWWSLPCEGNKIERKASPLDSGEGLAHVQLSKKYSVRFMCIGGPCKITDAYHFQPFYQSVRSVSCTPWSTWAPIFLVEGIGVSPNEINHGFEMS